MLGKLNIFEYSIFEAKCFNIDMLSKLNILKYFYIELLGNLNILKYFIFETKYYNIDLLGKLDIFKYYL